MTVRCLICAFIKIWEITSNIKNKVIEFKQSITVTCLFKNRSNSSCVFELVFKNTKAHC